MRIGLDARLVTYRRGMGNYVYNLLTSLAELELEHRLVLFVDRPEAKQRVPALWRQKTQPLWPPLYPVWEQLSLPLAAARERVDLLHCPANTAPAVLPAGCRMVVTVHDIMYLLPSSVVATPTAAYQRLGRWYRRLLVPVAVRKAAAVITDSLASRNDLVRCFPDAADRTHVVHLAAGSAFRQVAREEASRLCREFGVQEPFFLCLSGSDPRKNTRRVVEAFVLAQRSGCLPHRLVLVGGQAAHLAASGLAHDLESLGVVQLPYVSEASLVALYNSAEALVYPSLYEGFGLPVLEAMACGAPVITSTNGSLGEVAGDAALMVDPESVESIAESMLSLVSDRSLRCELVHRGLRQTSRFTWQRVAEETLSAYRKALD